MTVLAIHGSARANGDTQAVLTTVLAGRPATLVGLCELNIQHFEYDGDPNRDDFMQVVTAMLQHERILFVTPVYWYAMSGRLKVLFDRFTDLVTIHKSLGRELAGREVFVVACGTDAGLPEGFETPFRETAAYLGMAYRGGLYVRTGLYGAESNDLVLEFRDRLFS